LRQSGSATIETEAEVDPWTRFVERVRDKGSQLKVLHALKKSGPHQLNQLTDLVGAESTLDVGGVLGSIRRKTLSCGFKTADAVITKKGQFYLPGPALVANEDLPAPPKTRWDVIRENSLLDEEDK